MAGLGLRFLRPYLWRDLPRPTRAARSVHARFYHATRRRGSEAATPYLSNEAGDVQQRYKELNKLSTELYPRVLNDDRAITCNEFRRNYDSLVPEETKNDQVVTVRGRVHSSRIAGSKLVFLDIVQDGSRLQALCDLKKMESTGVTREQFKLFYHILRRGDIFTITGHPHRTKRGELSIKAIELPKLLSPSLHQLPTSLTDESTRTRNRHTDLLVNKQAADTFRLRSHIIRYMRDYFQARDFLEVETPILAGDAGGAIARPFVTTATEFVQQRITLRIAPELWLKRLVLGGMDRVFEIGRTFRNEGLDPTHNPEFTTCEFYKSFADLEDLIKMTEELMSGMAESVQQAKATTFTSLAPTTVSFKTPFRRLAFIPTIEAAIGQTLPDLSSPTATSDILQIFHKLSIPIPDPPTLPRLLDRLSSEYIEPQCDSPTFITHHPECLSPLSKSFLDPETQQPVSTRVELFVGARELVNAYEEENSPFEQRRKFVEQAQYRDSENEARVDESYLDALEWGLPPTGGWGCGIDRLCMLFSGATRIRDVLSFGSLRNVVGLSSQGSQQEGSR
ncbi:lysyl-tRNA synthetase [Xylona heveae TC161]|uniref:Lysine--tRNA ligase n=1 Tax=Xylona heveae (strain CBS 132557 / TC161) TaxID=1328760 RepID=A0A165GDU2_XYLHT|nr:lysyl-tRNA synthetase [Xylona heveae TC161]KZF22071.1 lysyl-tRNA synthetase [Xylona heveae TC161]